MGERRGAYCEWGNVTEGDHLVDLGVDERIILKWTSEKWSGGGAWTGLICVRIRTDGGLL